MTTLLLLDRDGAEYSLEALKVKPVKIPVQKAGSSEGKYILASNAINVIGVTHTHSLGETYTENFNIIATPYSQYSNLFQQYADMLLKSPNGVVDFRPVMRSTHPAVYEPR